MRHRKVGRQLNMKNNHRKAMFRNMIGSLIKYERIKTTIPKAKELRRFVEPLITISKKDNLSNRRLIFARIRNNEAVSKLFDHIGPRFFKTPGGYTRILKFNMFKNLAYIEIIK